VTTAEVIAEIVEAVAAEVCVDGSIRRGTDIVRRWRSPVPCCSAGRRCGA
jgi:isopentenyl diphosphate isomerase/L-lactate dehydrogenase-like FMN-dependent dehydrogenase